MHNHLYESLWKFRVNFNQLTYILRFRNSIKLIFTKRILLYFICLIWLWRFGIFVTWELRWPAFRLPRRSTNWRCLSTVKIFKFKSDLLYFWQQKWYIIFFERRSGRRISLRRKYHLLKRMCRLIRTSKSDKRRSNRKFQFYSFWNSHPT